VYADVIPREAAHAALRLNLPYFAVACAIAIGGVCSLFLVRLRSRDRLLLWVGIVSILYAARLFVQNELVREAFNARGTEYVPFALSLTYAINIPFALFALELLGRGWKASIAIWVWMCGAFAVIAILSFAKNASAGIVLRCRAFVTVVQAAKVRNLDDRSDTRDLPNMRTLLVES
jgi:uncharacterized membrane-anchored protein YitT (DUF2179 family)